MSLLDKVHGDLVFGRRVRVLARHLGEMLPRQGTVLDVGCGDGTVAKMVMGDRPDLAIEGIDVLVRPQTHIPVTRFDGRTIPHGDGSFDVVLFVDVLHHTDDPLVLLGEAVRVARRAVVIKDHNLDGILSGPSLRFMDWVGNARHGVVLPYNYWPERRWEQAFQALGLHVAERRLKLGLYPPPADWVFGRGLHFIARLEKSSRSTGFIADDRAVPPLRTSV
jgi:SAM-dependent methyltransferase